MGAVMTKIKLTNFVDRDEARRGLIAPEHVRALELDALVDTSATLLVLPEEVVEALGVPELERRPVRVADGRLVTCSKVGGLVLDILGREMVTDAVVMPRGTRALIGQIPLEELDLIVDPSSREVLVNPRSPHAPMSEVLATREGTISRTRGLASIP
jgi:clan AA aspartic protease